MKLKMRYFSFVKQFDIDISLVVLDLSQNFVEGVVVIGLNSLRKLVLGFLNFNVAVCAETDWSFFLQAVLVFIDPITYRILFAPELTAILTVVLDVTEIKLRTAAFLTSTVCSLDTFGDECSSLRMCGKIEWCVLSCVLQMDIDAERHEALQNFGL